MNAADLLARVRRRLDDTVGAGTSNGLWSDSEIIDDYANPVRDRMFLECRRLITDSSTVGDVDSVPLCQISLVADTGTYAISPKITEVVRLKLSSQMQPLRKIAAVDLDRIAPNWQDDDPGAPWGYCLDLDTDKVTFIPAPDADDTARLTVYRFPLTPISLDNEDDLGFRAEYQNDLIPGILAMAFSKKDSGTDRPDLAALEEGRFIRRLEEIKGELQRRVSAPQTNSVRRAFGSR